MANIVRVLLLWILVPATTVSGLIFRECRNIGDDEDRVSPQCAADYNLACEAWGNFSLWARMLFDSNGREESGKFLGNLMYEGDYDQCVYPRKSGNIEHPMQKDLHFCLALSSRVQGHGLCLPGSCTPDDFVVILKRDHRRPDLDLNSTALYYWCHDEEKSLAGDGAAIVSIVILSIFATLVLVATILHQVQKFSTKDDNHGVSEHKQNITTPIKNVPLVPNGISNGKVAKHNPPSHQVDNGVSGTLNGDVRLKFHEESTSEDKSTLYISTSDKVKKTTSRILLSFSLYQNVPKVLSAKRSSGGYGCLNGIRFLSMAWVILGHTYSMLGFYPVDNLITAGLGVEKFWFHAVFYGDLSVDTFFILSGMLVTIAFMKQMQVPKVTSKSSLAKHYSGMMGLYYLHRYIRLTPVYAIVIMITANLGPYLWANGPFWTTQWEEPTFQICKDTWWKNILYVNNLVDPVKQCVGVGWYLANDFQFFFILPLFLAPLIWAEHARKNNTMSKSRQTILYVGALGWIGLAIVGSMISRFYIAHEIASGNEELDEFYDAYIVPWTRSVVYFMAVYLGYIIYKTNGKVRLPKVVVFLGWLVAAGCVTLPIYLPYLYSPYCDGSACTGAWTVAGWTAFASLDRPMWALGIMWIIFVCISGYGGIANTILSWSGFIPLSRLTYCMYLLHPTVIYAYKFATPVQRHFSHYTWVYFILGNITLSLGAAFIFTLVFEIPLLVIQKTFLTPKKR